MSNKPTSPASLANDEALKREIAVLSEANTRVTGELIELQQLRQTEKQLHEETVAALVKRNNDLVQALAEAEAAPPKIDLASISTRDRRCFEHKKHVSGCECTGEARAPIV